MAVTIDGTLGVTTPTGTGDVSVGDDLIFTGTGNRITGDFSNATLASRVMFQTSTVNEATRVSFIPNGTSPTSQIAVYSNSDPTNASVGIFGNNNATVNIQSAITGTGTYLPMGFFTGGSERVRIDTSGNVGIGTSAPTVYSGFTTVEAGSTSGNAGLFSAKHANGNAIMFNNAGIATFGSTGVYSTTFITNSTEKMRIDTSGNVGIGTSSPGAKLAVAGGLRVGTAVDTSYVRVAHDTANGLIDTNVGALGYATPSGQFHYWSVGGSERMRINSSGDLLVGTTNNSFTAGAGFKLLDNGQSPSIVSAYSTSANSSYLMYSTGAAAYRFYVRWDGVIQATSTTITGISDQRLKENVQDLDEGLAKIMALKPRRFDWKSGKGRNVKGDRGWIAQEFEQVFPDMIDESLDPVPEGEEPYKTVRADLLPVLVKAIQEQQAIIKSLQDRITALEQA